MYFNEDSNGSSVLKYNKHIQSQVFFFFIVLESSLNRLFPQHSLLECYVIQGYSLGIVYHLST